jgi:hypothetical protein
MSQKKIKLLGIVFHDDHEYPANSVLTIPDQITETEANRLIQLNAAEYVEFIDETEPELTKKQCQEILTAAGIAFDKKMKLAELLELVTNYQKSLENDSDDEHKIDINKLNRDEIEAELTARAIEFNSEQSDDELRQLLIDDDSTDDE